jgi:DNA replication and repair protein RecF
LALSAGHRIKLIGTDGNEAASEWDVEADFQFQTDFNERAADLVQQVADQVESQVEAFTRQLNEALRQRNAALKQDRADEDLAAWESELASSGENLARQRQAYLARLSAPLGAIGLALLDRPITLAHNPGWDANQPLLGILQAGRSRDRRYRATQAGPHRGDVIVQVAGRPAKDHISRGQQKLVAAALMLAQLEIQEQERPGRSALLLDDPAAELDAGNLARLMNIVQTLPAQLWVTSLRADIPKLPAGTRVFHVEQGRVTWA